MLLTMFVFVCKLKPNVENLHNREVLGGIAIMRINYLNDMVYCRLISADILRKLWAYTLRSLLFKVTIFC